MISVAVFALAALHSCGVFASSRHTRDSTTLETGLSGTSSPQRNVSEAPERPALTHAERWARAPGFVKALYASYQRGGKNELYNGSADAWAFVNVANGHHNRLAFQVKSLFDGRDSRPHSHDLIQANLRLFSKPKSSLLRGGARKLGAISLKISVLGRRKEVIASSETLRVSLRHGTASVSITRLIRLANANIINLKKLRLKLHTVLLSSGQEVRPSDVFDLTRESPMSEAVLVAYVRKREENEKELFRELSKSIAKHKEDLRRTKRQAHSQADQVPVAVGSQCGDVQDLVVIFERIGWGHILAPVSFNAHDCVGSCKIPLANPSNHALVRAWVWHKTPRSRRPLQLNTCCVPTKYETVTMMISKVTKSDSETPYIIRTYNEMKAVKCGCR